MISYKRPKPARNWLTLGALMGVAIVATLWTSTLSTTAQPDSPAARARRHLVENAVGLGLRPDLADLQLKETRESLTATHVRYQQTVNGLPVFGGRVSVSVPGDSEREPVVTNRYRSHTKVIGLGGPGGPLKALTAAAASIGVDTARARQSKAAELVYFPGADRTLVPAWQLMVRTVEPLGSWLVLVDANTNVVLYRHNLLAFDSGQVFDPNPAQTNGGTAAAPHCDSVPNANLMIPEYVVNTLLGIAPAQGQLKGPYVDMTAPGIFTDFNFDGTPNDYKAPGLANEPTHTYSYPCNDDRFEEVMVYYHVDRTQRKIQSLGFTGPTAILDRPVPAHAHFMPDCNAFYDPSNRGLHFGDFDGEFFFPCPAPPLYDGAEDADVVIHEYGHAVQDDQVPGWGFGPYPLSQQTGAMGEGFGDFIAGVMNNNPCIGEYINFGFNSCGGAVGLRWLENSMTYPSGYQACPNVDPDNVPGTGDEYEEVHCGGLLWGGALWDLVQAVGGGSATQQARDTVLTLALEAHFFLDQQATFNEGAAAICLADKLLNAGANAGVIASTFSARGISSGSCNSSDFASMYVRVAHEYSGDLEIHVKVGSNVDFPLCSFNIVTPDITNGFINYVDYRQLGPCASFLPPTTTRPWWVQVQDGFALYTGEIAEFEVLLTGGHRCISTDPPVPIPDGFAFNDPPELGAPAYAKVDCTVVAGPTPTPTPTPAPTGAPGAFGNVDCAGGINSIDALKVLRANAALSYTQTEPCENIGTETLPNGELQGDVDCSGGVNSIDALKLLRHNAGLSVSQNEPPPCPDIGT